MSFASHYADLFLPVVVCRKERELPIVYMNMRAELMFAPTRSAERGSTEESAPALRRLVRFHSEKEFHSFTQMVETMGRVDDYPGELITFDGRLLTVTISGKSLTGEDGQEHIVLYLLEQPQLACKIPQRFDNQITSIINASFATTDVEASIQTIITLAGKQADVCRVYIFEEISPTTTRNTYEWCREGVEPAIQGLQNLDKADYPYDQIVGAGMFVAGDVALLPESDRTLLEPQGIRSLAIIPFYDSERPLGYVGFDDCEKPRVWSHEEIQFLRGISAMLAVLIKRRDAEQDARHSREILQIIMDTLEDLVYVNSPEDFSVKFVNRALAQSMGKTQQELMGGPCYKMFQSGQNAPCPFCPMPKLHLREGEDRSDTYTWEHYNDITGRTYMVKDRIIKWVDGTNVHVETATDITKRMEYESQLEKLASLDAMTGVYNRQWGGRVLTAKLADPAQAGSLCFLDVDGLKKTNDHLGHHAGDGLLVEFVEFLQRHLGERDVVCRWGGDEFLVWMGVPETEAQAVMERVQQDMDRANAQRQRPYRLSFSYGITAFRPGNPEDFDLLVTQADERMYRHKMARQGISFNRRRTDWPDKQRPQSDQDRKDATV